MAPIEVIDLISDSEDDDHTSGKAASSTLKSFQPRKDKQLPKAQANTTAAPLPGPQPRTLAALPLAQLIQHVPIAPQTPYARIAPSTQYGNIAPFTQHYAPSSRYAPIAPSIANYATIEPMSLQQQPNVVSDSSVSGILRHGLPSAALSAGLAVSQRTFAPQPSITPQQVNAQREIPGQTIWPQESPEGHNTIPGNLSEAMVARRTGGPLQEERQRHFQDYHRKEAERKSVETLSHGQTEINPVAHLYTDASASGQAQTSASTMADIINYAEPGEDLDWTKITEPHERKRMQNIINGRKYRERRLAAEGHGGSGGNYPGASGAGSYMSPGYGAKSGGNKAGHAPVASMLPMAPEPVATAQPNGHPSPAPQQSLPPSANNASLPHGRRLSPQANGDSEPKAKRPKFVHNEEAEDDVGMREARRLSAATIGINEAGHNFNGVVPSLPGPATSHADSTPAPNSHVNGAPHPTSLNPAVVGPASLGPDQINASAPAAKVLPANNDSTVKGNGKRKAQAKGKGKAKVNNSQPTPEEAVANYMKDYQQKVITAMESFVSLKPERGKPRKPPQPKFETPEEAKRVKEWKANYMRRFEKALGLENLSDTDEDDNTPWWEKYKPKPGAQHVDDSDSSSSDDESSSDIVPPASKSTQPLTCSCTTHTAPSDDEYISCSQASDGYIDNPAYKRSESVASLEYTTDSEDPDGFRARSPAKNNPINREDSSPLFVPERSNARSPANNQGDSERPSPDIVPATLKSKSPAENRTDILDSSPDFVPARSQPSRPFPGAKTTNATLFIEDGSDSDSSSPDVIPARPNNQGLAETPCDIDVPPSDVVPARTQPTRPSLVVKLRYKGSGVDGPCDSDSSSPDFVPAKANPVPRANDALKNFLSRPSEPAPVLAMTNDKGLQKRIETNAKALNTLHQTKPTINSPSNHGIPYTKEEDDLLKYLREERKVSWDEMINHFSGRTRGSLQVRYSTKLKNRNSTTMHRKASEARVPSFAVQATTTPQEYAAPARRVHKATVRDAGMVPWADIIAKRREGRPITISETIEPQTLTTQIADSGPHAAIPASISRLLRSREMGHTGWRNWSSKARLKVPDELQNHVLDTLGPSKFFHGASRDVTCVAWANDGNRFAAGAIAIDDERSMQYNRPNNLLLGNNEMNSLKELPEHHVSRPAVSDFNNVNSLHAMQETQDPRLFKTVAAVAFSGDSQTLYSAGGDGMVRMYDSSNAECQKSFSQETDVVLLTANSRGLLASGCHRSDDSSISVLGDQLDPICKLGPTRTNVQSSLPIFPSALKWGAGRYSGLLLAGFASDSYDEDRLAAGEVCLWDVAAGNKIELPTVRNVFDVAWNPSPSAASTLFAVACARSGRTFRSSIECFAPHQGRARSILKWDCQAFDINDVLYCPHDDNLIAAGATDGKVYVWDKRFSNRGQAPLHVFAHHTTKNVLDPERDLEITDTGVRFLSWSATGNRLYSGSSDGTVKVWNPYCTTQDAFVRNVATFNSAIMSGAFSPDYRELLVGEDQGQLNLLGIDREARPVRAAKKFDYYPAPPATAMIPSKADDRFTAAQELLGTKQIEFKPMGALPKMQAVQGPNYQGPFLAPLDELRQDLATDYQLALQHEKKALAVLPRDFEATKSIKSAQLQVSQTRDAVRRAQQKTDDSKSLARAASLLQDQFRQSRHEWKKAKIATGAKTCRLGCNYLPADNDGEAPDDRRSEQRVPGSIRPQRKILVAGDMTNSEVAEAGLTSKCIGCTGPAAKPKSGLPFCESCSLSRSGLTARCSKCATPTRPNLKDGDDHSNICERCNFHCFRCGSVAAVSTEGDTVTCELCGIEWEAGALGYEVNNYSLKPTVSRVRDEESLDREMESLEQCMVRLFGDDERERLAGGWKVALVDGSVDS
jgi:WD40 repeat protein